jgi:hypothetical protein
MMAAAQGMPPGYAGYRPPPAPFNLAQLSTLVARSNPAALAHMLKLDDVARTARSPQPPPQALPHQPLLQPQPPLQAYPPTFPPQATAPPAVALPQFPPQSGPQAAPSAAAAKAEPAAHGALPP